MNLLAWLRKRASARRDQVERPEVEAFKHAASSLTAADVAIVFVDANSTAAAAETAARVLAPDGCAITFQNGIGNVETLQAALGSERVLGGSSMCSAATRAPGHVTLTHMGLTSVGELDGNPSARATAVVEALQGAGFQAAIEPNPMGLIWQKFVVNCATNAIAAITGLRGGEIVRLPELDAFQDRVLDEIMAPALTVDSLPEKTAQPCCCARSKYDISCLGRRTAIGEAESETRASLRAGPNPRR